MKGGSHGRLQTTELADWGTSTGSDSKSRGLILMSNFQLLGLPRREIGGEDYQKQQISPLTWSLKSLSWKGPSCPAQWLETTTTRAEAIRYPKSAVGHLINGFFWTCVSMLRNRFVRNLRGELHQKQVGEDSDWSTGQYPSDSKKRLDWERLQTPTLFWENLPVSKGSLWSKRLSEGLSLHVVQLWVLIYDKKFLWLW